MVKRQSKVDAITEIDGGGVVVCETDSDSKC